MTQTTTNASNVALSEMMSALPVGRFVGLITRKKGKAVGRGAARMVYGDDETHVVIFTGFKYISLVQRSLDKAQTVTAQALLDECQRRGKTGKSGAPITLADCTKAIDDQIASFQATLGGTSTSTTDHVYEPLTVNGESVRGCRVYSGSGNPSDPKAPVPGTIYLQGLKIGERILTPAPNGPIPASNSRGDVVAKGVLRSMLPVSRYVSYALEPGSDYILRAGKAAIEGASDGTVVKADIAATVSDLLAEEG